MILRPTISASRPCVDHYVRVTGRELAHLSLDLVWTDCPEASSESLGYAEWVGRWRGAVVSVACTWRSSAGGPVLSSDPLEVSTNLMLVDAKGYDAGSKGTAVALMQLLHTWILSELDEPETRNQRPAGFGGRLQ